MHPGLLKLELVRHGATLAPGLQEPGGITGTALEPLVEAPELHGQAPSAVDLLLPGELLVRVPLVLGPGTQTPFTLGADGERAFVVNGLDGDERPEYEVRVLPPPQFYQRHTALGTSMRSVATVYGSCLVVSPGTACGFSLRGAPCTSCAGWDSPPAEVRYPEIVDVVEVVRRAFDEGAAELVCFNGPFSATEDGGIATLDPYINAVRHHFDTLIAAYLHPPRSNKWIDRAYAMGIDAVSFGVEAFDPDAFRTHFPGRARHIGRERYYDALGYAASTFPEGTVWSELIVGLEPTEATMHGIEELAAVGVVPVLGVTSPLGSRPVAHVPSEAAQITSAGAHLYRVVKSLGINMGRLWDFNTGVTPLEARFFVGDDARLAVTMHSLYRSKIGSIAARHLARLRRRLRVRAVRHSLDASGL